MREPASFTAHRRTAPWIVRSAWPCAWVSGSGHPPCVRGYRLRFTSERTETLRLIVTADERYRLFLDGRLLRSGPEIGSRHRWQADAIAVEVPAGEHLLQAIVWSVGDDGDFACDGIRHGFALGVDGPANARLATGTAAWEWHDLPGYTFRKSKLAHWTVPDVQRDGAITDWAAEAGGGDGWAPVHVISPVHHVGDVEIFPARLVELGALPPMLHRPWTSLTVRHAQRLPTGDPAALPLGANDPALAKEFTGLLTGRPLHVPAGTTVRAVIDCGTYLTAWSELSAGGAGARIRIEWMEALAQARVVGAHIDKGQRSEIAGRYVGGLGDELHCDGLVRDWRSLYWRAGRFIIITVTAGAAPAVLTALHLAEDRYPLEQEATIAPADPGLARALPLCLRAVQVNCHDLISDTPYYERMQYIGDCRITCLNLFVLARDERLTAKALRMTDAQRLPDGLTVSRGPTRNMQVITTFSLWYVGMLHDRLLWRGDLPLLRELMPGARGALDAFLRHLRPDGTLGFMEGWAFCDWVKEFKAGEPPGSAEGSGPANLQLLMALGWAEELETALGEPELAARWRRLRLALAPAIDAAFWDARRGLWADDRARTGFSQHSQALAALCPDLPEAKRHGALAALRGDASLARSSIYFLHYLFEAWRTVGDGSAMAEALAFWAALPDQGFTALPEQPEPSRSDSHAWGAHPLFHLAATIAGIRPTAPGFARARIAPCLGALPAVTVRVPHPSGGWIGAELAQSGSRITGRIELPVPAELVCNGRTVALPPGTHNIA